MISKEVIAMGVIVLVTMIFSACIMPFMKKIAHHIGAIDYPSKKEGNRHIHQKATPKLGGVGIFLAFLFGYMLFGHHSIKMNAILIGSFIIVLTGIIDDIKPIKASQKLIGQVIAALIIACYGKILLQNISAFGYVIDFGIFTYPITVIFIVACVNIINLIDGIDGLSGGISSIFYLTVGIISLSQARYGSLEILLAFIMLGATLGFLIHNFNPASIFAGDCSMFMGFLIAVITLLGFKATALTSFFIPIIILIIPILDTCFAIIRRKLKGKPIFSADKDHIHHQLIKMNLSQKTTVLIIYFVDLLFAIATLIYALKDPKIGMLIYIVLFVIILIFVCNTNIISDKLPKKLKKITKTKK